MTAEIVEFPGNERIVIDVDSLVERLAAVGEYPRDLFSAAVKSIGTATERVRPNFSMDDASAFFHDLGVAYFALGAMIGADRKVMVENLRPRPET